MKELMNIVDDLIYESEMNISKMRRWMNIFWFKKVNEYWWWFLISKLEINTDGKGVRIFLCY